LLFSMYESLRVAVKMYI